MSYILDALKKADAERERAGVPGLHAQVAAATTADEARRAARRWRNLALAALLLSGAAALGWWWTGTAPTPTVPVAPPATAPSPVPTAKPVAPAPEPATASAATPPPTTLAAPTTATSPPRIVVPPAPPTPASPSPTADERLPVYPDLPPEVKRQLPALAVSGSVYAPVAASRMVIVNGQVLREGDSVAEGLVVERIGLKSSQLSWRGTRFELRH